jgi:hypothetical protein
VCGKVILQDNMPFIKVNNSRVIGLAGGIARTTTFCSVRPKEEDSWGILVVDTLIILKLLCVM